MISFLGDVFLDKRYNLDFKLNHPYIFNLEYPITTHRIGYPFKVNLKSEANHIKETFGNNPTAVCISNNHILDYNEEGFFDTINELKKENILFFGAGNLSNNANNPLIIKDSGDIKTAIIGYCSKETNPVYFLKDRSGVAPASFEKIKEDINYIKENNLANRIVVSIHWGLDDVYLPSPANISLARNIIDSGADLIIGHHSHCIQPFEIYNDKYIFYGIGNCIMPDINTPSFYNEAGLNPINYRKKQLYWNKVSLLVNYCPLDNSVIIEKLKFKNEYLKKIYFNSSKYILPKYDQKKFNNHVRLSRLKKLALNFIYNPKIPKLKHLKYIFRK